MKIKDGLMLCKVGDSRIVMASGSTMHLSGLTTINETGEFIWEQLRTDTDEASVLRAVCSEFDVDEQTAAQDVHDFIESLRKADFLA